MSQIQIRNNGNRPLRLINFTVSKSDNPEDPYIEDFFTDLAGNSSWPHYGVPHDNVFLHINYFNRDVEFQYQMLPVNTEHDIFVTLKREKLERAYIDGYYSSVFLKGESAFLDLYRLILGQDIRSLLDQSVDLGSNARRNFLMCYNTPRATGLPEFNPDNHGNFFDKLEEMLQLYDEYGLYLYASVFPDNGLFSNWNNTQKQIDHWNRIGTIAQRYNNVWGLELTNEINDKTFNRVDITKFSPIPGVICCSGSITDYGIPADLPDQWDVIDFHQTRNYPKSATDACLANFPPRESHGKATLLGEPVGFGDKNVNHNREDNPRIAKEIAGSARGTACGIIFHSQNGGFSQTYDDTEKRCAEAWFKELE